MFQISSKDHSRMSFFLFVVLAAGVGILNAQPGSPTERLKSTTTSPERLSASFAEVAKIVEPAVVSIDTKGKLPEITTKGEAAPGERRDDRPEPVSAVVHRAWDAWLPQDRAQPDSGREADSCAVCD